MGLGIEMIGKGGLGDRRYAQSVPGSKVKGRPRTPTRVAVESSMLAGWP